MLPKLKCTDVAGHTSTHRCLGRLMTTGPRARLCTAHGTTETNSHRPTAALPLRPFPSQSRSINASDRPTPAHDPHSTAIYRHVQGMPAAGNAQHEPQHTAEALPPLAFSVPYRPQHKLPRQWHLSTTQMACCPAACTAQRS